MILENIQKRAKTFRFILDVNAGKALDVIELFQKVIGNFQLLMKILKGKNIVMCSVMNFDMMEIILLVQ